MWDGVAVVGVTDGTRVGILLTGCIVGVDDAGSCVGVADGAAVGQHVAEQNDLMIVHAAATPPNEFDVSS